MSDSILLSVADGLAHVTLNRPERLNAINADAAYRWRDIAAEIAARNDIRAVLFDAAGRAFCAGGDVVAMSTMGGADAESSGTDSASSAGSPSTVGAGTSAGAAVHALADVIHEGHRLLRESSVPIVAAVQGAVAGGGLGFMLVADVIVASERASFASKYADIALTPDCGVSTLLPEAIGARRALELLLTPRTLSAAEALDWALVTEVVPADAVADRALAIAQHWQNGASAAFGQAKRLVHAGRHRSFQASLDDEAATIGAAFDTTAATERIAAFTAR